MPNQVKRTCYAQSSQIRQTEKFINTFGVDGEGEASFLERKGDLAGCACWRSGTICCWLVAWGQVAILSIRLNKALSDHVEFR
ncbi:hypothetical protein KSP40_PGU012861 [Platanthera guangdongensis]|uniref:Uncharacterized protein n=1 Tax=Platanthera guangdongensis TaxID=2320717 RepID=A0ABR2MXV8_9ASPA